MDIDIIEISRYLKSQHFPIETYKPAMIGDVLVEKNFDSDEPYFIISVGETLVYSAGWLDFIPHNVKLKVTKMVKLLFDKAKLEKIQDTRRELVDWGNRPI